MKLVWMLCVILWSISSGVVYALPRPYNTSVDGQEVTDLSTGLIWRRCAEGMVFNGVTCTGFPNRLTHEAAILQAAAQANATGKAWRLPNIKELSSLVDRTRFNPAIDTVAFPSAPTGAFWSASPNASFPGSVWFVGFYNGAVGASSVRFGNSQVWLVRSP